ncbi:MAG: hypothetical protein IT348_19440 [Candidatus Eisenbacteria bacterium]|nr:hypothetical protein [Candidatus Eisenbacteria bacterium]
MRRPALLLACIAALLAASCDRRPTLIPASADSTAVAPDSFSVQARRAADAWEAGDDGAAASASALLAREALDSRPNAPWAERVRGVLDSLGIGAEVSGGNTATVVNLFSRVRPDGDAWPYLFWREQGAVRSQALETRGLHLSSVATLGMGDDSEPNDSAQVAVLWDRRVGAGAQPQLAVWKHADGGRWDLLQMLGPDSLGGTGTGEFAVLDSSTELTTRTYRNTPWFDECASCPHVFHEHRFEWRSEGFARVGSRLVPSPYSTFAAFIAALMGNDRAKAGECVVDPSLVDFARRYDWHVSSHGRWRVAPATDESAIEMVFFRGQKEAFRVMFEPREREWLIAGFEATSRDVD